jgi:hypothetical protein
MPSTGPKDISYFPLDLTNRIGDVDGKDKRTVILNYLICPACKALDFNATPYPNIILSDTFDPFCPNWTRLIYIEPDVIFGVL